LVVVGHPWYARNEPEEDERETQVTPHDEDIVSERQPPTRGATASRDPGHSKLDVAYQTTYYVNATDPEHATPILLRSGERATVDLHLFAVPAVRLKIRGVPGFANAGGSLKLSEQIFTYSRQVASQGIDQDGAEFSSLAPGHYVLQYPPQEPGSRPQQQPLDLVADTEVGPGEGGEFVSVVTGIVQLGASEAACQRCLVRLVNVSSREGFNAQSTPKGFEFEGGVRPSRYLVLVFKQEGYLIKDITAVGAKVVGTELDVPPGAAVRLTIVMTKDYSNVDGVALRDGKPVSGAMVILVPNDSERHRIFFRRDQSDSDGTFTLSQVLPGEYTVMAVAEGWDLEWTNPTVLKAYLRGGVKVRVRADGKYYIRVNVQALEGRPN
jgi:hypothetical protein